MKRVSSLSTTHSGFASSRKLWLVAAIFFVLVLWVVFKPPFVIKPLEGPESSSEPVESKGAQFAAKVWESKVIPTILENAHDIAKIVPEIRADPESAGEKYGRRESTNPFSYMVKGTGKVTEVNTKSRAGTLTLEIPGLEEKIALQIGPVVRGTALRDATGATPFSQFANQLDYADVSKEMNKRAVEAAFSDVDPSSLSGKTISFFGAFTFNPRSKKALLVTPVKVEQ